MSAYDMSKQAGPWGISVDEQLDRTAAFNTSFDNNGFQEALQNRCLMKPGMNLPVWPKGLHTYSRPQLDKPAQQNINARVPLEFGRPFLPDQEPVDSGLFVPVAEMQETVAVRYPEGGILPPAPPAPQVLPQAAAMAAAVEKKKSTATTSDDSQCALNHGSFSLNKLPGCSVSSMAALFQALGNWKAVPGSSFWEKLKHAFTDNSRLFYLMVWIVLVLLCLLLAKVLFKKPPQEVNYVIG